MYTEVLSLLNLRCSGCSKKIKKALSALPDVSDIRFNEDTRDLNYDYKNPATPQDVLETIRSLGYPLMDDDSKHAKPIVCCPASVAAHKTIDNSSKAT